MDAIAVAPPGLDGGEMVVVGIEQRLRRLDGRGRQRLAPRIGRLEMPQKRRRPPRKPLGLLVEVAVETSAPCGVEIGLAHENVGGRPDGGGARQDLVHGLGQHRIMGQPVAQRLDGGLEVSDALALLRDQRGPARKPCRQIVDPVGLGPAATALAQPVGGGLQRVVNGGVGAVRQHPRLHPQRARQFDQKLAADPPAVVLDQVEIGR